MLTTSGGKMIDITNFQLARVQNQPTNNAIIEGKERKWQYENKTAQEL